MILSLYSTLVMSQCTVQFRASQYKRGMDVLQNPGKGQKDHYGTGASLLWIKAEISRTVQPEEKACEELLLMYINTWREDKVSTFWVVPHNRTEGDGYKGKHTRFLRNIWRLFFSTVIISEPWHRQSREVVKSSFSEIFKDHLSTLLGSGL